MIHIVLLIECTSGCEKKRMARTMSLLVLLKSIVPFLLFRADAQQIHQALIVQHLNRRGPLLLPAFAPLLAYLFPRLLFLFPFAHLLLIAPFFDSCLLGRAHLVVDEAIDGKALLVLLLNVVVEAIVLDDFEGHEAE